MTERYVADAHSLIWYLAGDPRLSRNALSAFEEVSAGRAVLLVPAIVVAEIIWVIEKNRTPVSLERLWAAIHSQPNWRIMVLDEARLRCLASTTDVSEMHDRFIVCEARISEAALVTNDEAIRSSGLVEVVW